MSGEVIGGIDPGFEIERGIREGDHVQEVMNDGGTMIGIRGGRERGATRRHAVGGMVREMALIEAMIDDAEFTNDPCKSLQLATPGRKYFDGPSV